MDRKIEKKNWPPKKIIGVSLASLFVIVVFYTFVFGDKSSKLNVEAERITISTVKYGPFQEYIPITGEIQPIETFFLDVTEGGRVLRKFVEPGATVLVGDPIIQLENADLALRTMYNEAQLFQQINNLRSTRLSMEQNRLSLRGQLLQINFNVLQQKRQYETNKKLYEKNLISKIEFENSRDLYNYQVKLRDLTIETHVQDSLFRIQQVEELEVSVKQMQQNLNITKRQLENLTVKAPISGQLTSLYVEIGQSISPGQNLGQIDNINSYKVRAEIDEHYIARVKAGQMGEYTFSGTTYDLVIKSVFPEVRNGRFEVDLLFSDEVPDGIRRGQTCHIKLELGELKDALFVDRGGFYQTTGGQWIFVYNESDGSAVRRKIRLGQQNSQVFEILEGLEEGEQVITSSYDNYGDIEKLIIN